MAIDRLGSGDSDRPPSEEVTADASAAALHDVIGRLRGDLALRTATGRVFTLGHSSGSTLAIREAATYHDVDGLIITGFLHTPGSGSDLFLSMLHLAAEDPKFEGDRLIPTGYVTTQPAVRILWYYGWNAEERILALDEQRLKDAMPGTDSGGFVDEAFVQPRSPELDVPVLILVGDRDLSNCSPGCPGAAAEPGFWTKSPNVRVAVRPRVAHALNLHRDARETTELIRRFLDRHS